MKAPLINPWKIGRALLLLLWSAGWLVAEQPAKHTALPSRSVHLAMFMGSMGKKLGCYFTLEKFKAPGYTSTLDNLQFQLVTNTAAGNNVDEFLLWLKARLPDCSVTQSAANPRIIHLKEAPLVSAKDYALDKVADVSCSGILADLPDAIGKRVEGIASKRSWSTAVMVNDYSTKVRINVSGQQIRRILTDHLPLANRHPILWIAEASGSNGKFQTVVFFSGPRDKEP